MTVCGDRQAAMAVLLKTLSTLFVFAAGFLTAQGSTCLSLPGTEITSRGHCARFIFKNKTKNYLPRSRKVGFVLVLVLRQGLTV